MIREQHIEQLVAKYIKNGDTVSIGTSDLGVSFLKKLALALEHKHVPIDHIQFVPTSNKMTVVANQLKIPITNLNESEIDVAIEFVDAVDEDYNFIKRDSFSLVRDKMISQSSGILVAVAEEKNFSQKIGGEIPFEIVPFGWKRTISQLSMFGRSSLVQEKGKPKKTETGNFLAQVRCDEVFSLEDIEFYSKQIPGVLESGLFVGLADKIVLHNSHLKVMSRTEYEQKALI